MGIKERGTYGWRAVDCPVCRTKVQDRVCSYAFLYQLLICADGLSLVDENLPSLVKHTKPKMHKGDGDF